MQADQQIETLLKARTGWRDEAIKSCSLTAEISYYALRILLYEIARSVKVSSTGEYNCTISKEALAIARIVFTMGQSSEYERKRFIETFMEKLGE